MLPSGAPLQNPAQQAQAFAAVQQLAQAQQLAAAGMQGAVPGAAPQMPAPQPAAATPPPTAASPAPTPAGAAAAAAPAAAGPAAPAAGAKPAQRQKKRKFGQTQQAAPEKMSTAVPESALYNHLLDLDRAVSDTIARRKADFKEPFPPYNDPVKRVMRLTVQAHYQHQPVPPKAPIVVPQPTGLAGPSVGNAAILAAAQSFMFQGAAAAAAAAAGSGSGDAAAGASGAGAAGGGAGPSGAEQAQEPPSWTLTISGALVDPTEHLVKAALTAAAAAAARGDPSAAMLMLQAQNLNTQHQQQQAKAKEDGTARLGYLTNIVRRMEVHLDPELYPGEQGRIVWDKAAHTGLHREAVEVRRLGGRSCKATVLVWPDYLPERYVLPPLLAEVLGMVHGHETRSRVMVALYGFIKSRKLQDPGNPINIHLTDQLAQVFGCRTLKLNELRDRLVALLTPVPPVKFEYHINLDNLTKSFAGHAAAAAAEPAAVAAAAAAAGAATPAVGVGSGGGGGLSGCLDMEVVDVDFFTPSLLPHQMAAVLQSYYKDKEIEAMDAKLAGLIRRLNEARRRRAILLGFAHAPIDMTHALLAAQARELRMGKQGSGRDYEVERRTEVFRQRWVEDAVMSYLHKRMGRPLDTNGAAGGVLE
ncbi:hypothetical protein CHLRE_10g448700v5 [Chlamydomonas reinhardtii]|uniref:DM2 domain-containing protein n=1 Tax=Chlamydomonas reinhardtii TaxID=3055 RepID=A8HZJ8_CHLRE|nr:uncharacterized protein CHLRE_10g448700v5 [Chlamydomonas reinhardtii]PNW77717.1 hypothetical protein CHLRE_10g448700v5 [Chlamydomonas reinhardtii]BAS31040.1 hypothetical protein [Chlamydomonas reinhardtii]|eukprot:XP_001698488.1 SWI/SNF chromatin remodeling complex protein [Chlamydomonas reinhardtii]